MTSTFEQIAGILGIVTIIIILVTKDYWLSVDKLNDVLTIVMGLFLMYGAMTLFKDITRWWLS